MPRRVRTPADAAQNRANQQRSRARRRAHVAALEARVRELEARDAQASVEMQRAARHVAWRNAKLLELLESRGMTGEEVESWLRAREEEERRGDGCASSAVKRKEKGPLQPEAKQQQIVAAERTGPEEGRQCKTTGDGRRTTVCQGGMRHSTLDPRVDGGSVALITPCDAAASIIADFQGHGDATQARGILGCGSEKNCHVKNTRLFQLMDETSRTLDT
ncbi:hypothetical protein F4780DRAFT_683351 [Xylariomycetidae sp. FL0641]|nr:hypothetical protein F4780DRAFT_683351 [Xylariomycetidae sp. FL0641]